jgi:hypothetical protein
MPVIPTHGKQDDLKFEANHSYIARPCSQKGKGKENGIYWDR